MATDDAAPTLDETDDRSVSHTKQDAAPSRVCARLRTGVEVDDLVAETDLRPDLWLARARREPEYRDSQHVYLEGELAGHFFPVVMRAAETLARELGGVATDLQIVRIYKHSRIYKHATQRKPKVIHAACLVLAGQLATADGEGDPVTMEVGELWSLPADNRRELVNPTGDWTVLLTFDVKSAEGAAQATPRQPAPKAFAEDAWPVSEQGKALRDKVRTSVLERALTHASPSVGILSPDARPIEWLLDIRAVFLHGETMDAICDLFWDRYASELPFQLAGMEIAAIPLVVALVQKAHQRGLAVNGVIVRKERKKHGLSRLIEGQLTSEPVFLVDDVFNSGSSAEKARVSLVAEGARVTRFFAVVDFASLRGAAWRRAHDDVSFSTLFKLGAFGKNFAERKRGTQQTRTFVPLWNHRPKTGFPFHYVPKSAPLYLNGRLFFGTDAGSVRAIETEKGTLLWELKLPNPTHKGIWSCLAHHDGKLYFGGYMGILYSISAADGSIVWETPACEWIGSSPLLLPERDLLVVGLEYATPNRRGSVAAFRMSTGEKVWEADFLRMQHGLAAFAPKRDLVIVGSSDHEMLALEPDTGKIVWRSPMGRSVKYAPAIDEQRGIVVAGSYDKSIYVFDLATGRRLAEFPTGDILYTTPLIAAGRIFCGSGDRSLYVIDADKLTLIKKIPQNGRVYSSPRLVDGSVFFATTGGSVQEMNPTTLEVLGQVMVPDGVTNAIATNETSDRIFVATYMNEIYAYQRVRFEDLLAKAAAAGATPSAAGPVE